LPAIANQYKYSVMMIKGDGVPMGILVLLAHILAMKIHAQIAQAAKGWETK
jgi:hypothetical protein